MLETNWKKAFLPNSGASYKEHKGSIDDVCHT